MTKIKCIGLLLQRMEISASTKCSHAPRQASNVHELLRRAKRAYRIFRVGFVTIVRIKVVGIFPVDL